MKKMMMLLMVSVFFLVGGMTEGSAQKTESKNVKKASDVVTETVSLGGKVTMIFNLNELAFLGDLSEVRAVYVYFLPPASGLTLYFAFHSWGQISYKNPKLGDRFSASYLPSNREVVLTIFSASPEDEGSYYIAVEMRNGMFVYSRGTHLYVLRSGK